MQIVLASGAETAETAMAFRFKQKPRLRFNAGQFGEFTLSSPAFGDAQGNTLNGSGPDVLL